MLNSDLVECIFFFFCGELIHFDFFECVDLLICASSYFVDCAVGALAELAQRDEIANTTHYYYYKA